MRRLPKIPKRWNRKELIQQNDDLFREIIRKRDKICQRTYTRRNLQVAHFFTRSNLTTRWDLDNACLLNAGVHHYWAHSRRAEFRAFWINRIGQEKFDRLEIKTRCKGHIPTCNLALIREELKRKLDNGKT